MTPADAFRIPLLVGEIGVPLIAHAELAGLAASTAALPWRRRA